MLQCLILHHSHDGSYTQSVVGTQCCALGLHPLAINPWLDGISLKVMGTLGSLLWYHIHVCLQDNTLLILHTRSSGFTHHDVVSGVLKSFYTCLLSKIEQELLYFLQMS